MEPFYEGGTGATEVTGPGSVARVGKGVDAHYGHERKLKLDRVQ